MRRILTSFFLAWTTTASAGPLVVESPTPAASKTGHLIEHIGIETLGGVFTPLLEKGCKIPCSITEVFSTADDNQTELRLSLLRGNAKLAKQTKFLGKYAVVGIDRRPRGTPQIAITFTVRGATFAIEAFDNQRRIPLAVVRRET